MTLRVTVLIGGIALIAGCTEPPPRSVQEFLDNPLVLEAALVRCSHNRAETRYEAECVNAREASKIVAAREEEARRADLEAQSERKRQALRRAQEAAAAAQRRVAEEERLREEADYLEQFGEAPPDDEGASESDTGNVPVAIISQPVEESENATEDTYQVPVNAAPSDSDKATIAESVMEQESESALNLDEIRDELKRRSD